MKLETIKIKDLKPYDNNAKEHSSDHITQIVRSIREFGFNDPIAVDENNMIIEGHGRLEALKILEYEEVPVIRLEGLEEAQKRAYIIAHNKLTMNSGFNLDKLEEELKSIPDNLLEITGFEEWELDNLFNRTDITDEEKYPEREESEKFCLKLFIDKEHRTKINEYIEDNGQDQLVEYILDLIVQE